MTPKLKSPSTGLGLIIAVCACIGAYWVASNPRRATIAAGPLRIEPSSLNFGKAWEDGEFHHDLFVTNTSDEDVEIAQFVTSCNCLSVEPKSLTIRSSETAQIRLTYSFLLSSRRLRDVDSTEVELDILPEISKGSTQKTPWILRGQVNRLLRLNPSEVFFETDLVQGMPYEPRRVLVRSSIPLVNITPEYPDHSAEIHIIRNSEDAKEFVVEITPHKLLPAGPFHFDLLLKPKSTEIKDLPSVKIRVGGAIKAEVQPTPEIMVLGVRHIGSEAIETIVLKSVTNKAFVLESQKNQYDDLFIEKVADQGKSTKTMRIRQMISHLGAQERSLQLVFRNEDGNPIIVPFKVSYIGVP